MQDWQLHEDLQVPQSEAGAYKYRPRTETVSLRVWGHVRGPGMEMDFNFLQSPPEIRYCCMVKIAG